MRQGAGLESLQTRGTEMAIISDQMAEQETAQPDSMGEMPTENSQSDNPNEEKYQRLGMAVMRIIYGKGTTEPLLDMLKAGASNPANAIAQAAMAVIAKIKNNIKDAREKQKAYAIAPAAVVFLIELGDAAGLFEGDVNLIPESLKILGEMANQDYGGQQTAQMPQMMPQQPAQPAQTAQPMPMGA